MRPATPSWKTSSPKSVLWVLFSLCLPLSAGCPRCSTGSDSASTQATAQPGQIELSGSASFKWESSTFSSPTWVQVRRQQTKAAQDAFESTVATEGKDAFHRAPYEINVSTGKIVPSKPISVTLDLPDSIEKGLKSGEALYVFVEFLYDGENETLDSFEFVPIDRREPTRASVHLDPDAFTPLRNVDGDYEATVLLATGPRS